MNISEGLVLGVLGQSMIGLLAILGDNMETVKKLFKKLMEVAGKVSLIINDEKTKYMKLSRKDFTTERALK